MAILAAQNIHIEFQDKTILDNINVLFPENKITAILGPNGCGKSTLLRIIAGLQHHYEGEVLLNNKNLTEFSSKSIARKIAVLPQSTSVPADMTVEQVVAYGRFPYRSVFHGNRQEDKMVIAWAMEQTDIINLKGRQLTTLSGGERQRAWIAMALCQQPEILLLDEPTTYLDIAHQLEIMQIIAMLNEKQNMTVVMVLHDINHARLYADNVVVMKQCGIFAQGKPKQILSPELLGQVFNVKAFVYSNTDTAVADIVFPVGLMDK
ncbi:ABC transporter ATP-binding protein [Pectinatus frisingensis]|uniref:ABC transporter ATP-binding protein n=1 Tax=Pectinatus frisingensis TaxID=865 RepID=UPI0018C78766|nr:ABC transporter ATP-binding protein [Pectinatus frisingensis]